MNIEDHSKKNLDIYYNPAGNNLSLADHYDLYPDHPWNKWRLDKRDDENEFQNYISSVGIVTKMWLNKDCSGYTYRDGAPTYSVFDKSEKIIRESWIIGNIFHRINGPADRKTLSNVWYLFGHKINKKQHQQIMSVYDELGDWVLSFSLSTFEDYDEKLLIEYINTIEKEYNENE